MQKELLIEVKKLSEAPPPEDDVKVNDLSAMVKRKTTKRSAEDGEHLKPGNRLETAIEELKQKTGEVALENGKNCDSHVNGNGMDEEKPVEKRPKLDMDVGQQMEEKGQWFRKVVPWS